MCNRVQLSVSAMQHFHSCSMWHAGTCEAEVSFWYKSQKSVIKRITHATKAKIFYLPYTPQYFERMVCGVLPVPQSATLWHRPRWDGCHSSSGAAPHRGRAPQRCWTWRTSGSPADLTAAPKTQALSLASEGLLKVQNDIVTRVNITTVWNIIGELQHENCCFPLLGESHLER